MNLKLGIQDGPSKKAAGEATDCRQRKHDWHEEMYDPTVEELGYYVNQNFEKQGSEITRIVPECYEEYENYYQNNSLETATSDKVELKDEADKKYGDIQKKRRRGRKGMLEKFSVIVEDIISLYPDIKPEEGLIKVKSELAKCVHLKDSDMPSDKQIKSKISNTKHQIKKKKGVKLEIYPEDFQSIPRMEDDDYSAVPKKPMPYDYTKNKVPKIWTNSCAGGNDFKYEESKLAENIDYFDLLLQDFITNQNI